MTEQIRVGILGYGNLGRGVELALRANPDMKLVGFFTRRDPASLKTQSPDVPVYSIDKAIEMKDEEMLKAFCDAVDNHYRKDMKYTVDGLTVNVVW